MDSENPNVDSGVTNTPILKGRRARKDAPTKFWNGTLPFWVGIGITITGGILSMTLGGSFAQICVLIGMAFFIYGLCVESIVLLYRLIKEK